LAGELRTPGERIALAEAAVMEWLCANEASRRLAAIPGIGPIATSAIAATVADAAQFRSGRQFAARIGLVPR
jgi:transposase